ncbi:MAG: DUF5916 domain-containing protein [Pyrinomonadaceae bacterium]
MKYKSALLTLTISMAYIGLMNKTAPAQKQQSGIDKPEIVAMLKEKKVPVTIPQTNENDSPMVIDGIPDEDVWKRAAKFNDFIQTQPGDNITPSKKTEAYMLWDSKNLYIAFKCWDDKDKIRATVATRDQVFGEDNVRVWLDTFDDKRRAYILGWNPLGIQADGIFQEGEGNDLSLDIIMESKGVIQDWGWSVEVKIPFKSLRYQAGPGKNWGFNVVRNIDRLNDEIDSWMPSDRNDFSTLSQFGEITGFNSIDTERTLELVPSVTISESGGRVPANEVPAGRYVNEPIKQDYSLNLKYSFTPNITLDAAINPDFAEIEADEPVVTANQRFPIFFEEKRPFFLEGADIFSTPIRIFHSRTIVDPDYAAKVSGKIGKNSFGFLVASDNAPGNYDNDSRVDPNVRPYIDEFVDKNAMFAIARVKRDYGVENSIGFMGTARVFPENRNFLGSVDGYIKFSSASYMKYQFAVSNSRKCFFDPRFDDVANAVQAQRNGEICGGAVVNGVQELGNIYSEYRSGSGIAYYANYGRGNDLLAMELTASGKSPDFRSDSGFAFRTDTNSLNFSVRKSTKSKPDAKIIRFSVFGNASTVFDWRGRAQSNELTTNISVNFQGNMFFNLWGGVEKAYLHEDEFGLARNPNRSGTFYGKPDRQEVQPYFGGYFYKQISKRVSVEVNPEVVFNAFDYDFGGGNRYPRVSAAALADPNAALDPGGGKKFQMYAFLGVTPVDPWEISFTYTNSFLIRDDTKQTAYNANIYSLRTTYKFTRFLFARIRADYDTLSSNLSGQYLLGWTPSPGTALYVGYNENTNYNGFNPFTGNFEPGFVQNGRTFFLRASYLFRKSF